MEKRVRLELGDKRENCLEDRISELPDEILASILSLLTINEAGRSSVLSHRWERLWKSFTGCLNFDGTQRMIDIDTRTDSPTKEELTEEKCRYISWVNKVLDSLNGATLDGFRICFGLNEDSRGYIDKWIEYALKKRVQRLEFDLLSVLDAFPDTSVLYTFPCALIKQPCGLYSISTLTSLHFSCVNVSGELIEYFLSNCPLERLFVAISEHLLNLKVVGTSLRLKYLEIYQCRKLESVDISAPNLVSLKYFGQEIKLDVKNVPQLVELSIGADFHTPITYAFRCLSSYFSQLETLKVDINIQKNKKFTECLEFTNLKHFILKTGSWSRESLLGWTSLINASPFLHRFTLELMTDQPLKRRKMQKVTKCLHQTLKVVEFVGYVGRAADELAMYLIENACVLEKIMIVRRFPTLFRAPSEPLGDAKKSAAVDKYVRRLERMLRPGVELVVI